jgi:TonB family protein
LARIKRIVGESAAREPLPRSQTLPVVLLFAALASMIWRPQHAAPDLRAALDHLPQQALALLSGNPLLIERPALSISLPRPTIQPVRANSALQASPATPALEVPTRAVEIAPPQVSVATTDQLWAAREAAKVPTTVETPAPAPESADPVSQAPRSSPLRMVPPSYPDSARSAGIEGAVEIEYQIGTDGAVRQMRVIRAHPSGIIEGAAKAALGAWRFPATAAGEKRTQNFAFTLHNRARTEVDCTAPTGSLICRHPGD